MHGDDVTVGALGVPASDEGTFGQTALGRALEGDDVLPPGVVEGEPADDDVLATAGVSCQTCWSASL